MTLIFGSRLRDIDKVTVWSCYSSTEVTPPVVDRSCELIWAEVDLRNNKKMLVSSFYRRPGDTNTNHLEVLDASLKYLQSQYKSDRLPIILGGDYNLPER